MTDIAVIGEAVADAFPLASPGQPGEQGVLDIRLRPGGGPVNTAVALARLGTPTRYLGRLSHGPVGDLFRQHLTASGVDIGATVDAQEQATLALTAVDAAGHATYDFYLEGTADWQWTSEELAFRQPAEASCIHTGSLALAMGPGGRHIEDLLSTARDAATISIDPNVRPQVVHPEVYQERLATWTALADLVRLSEEDLAHLHPGATFDQIFDEWHGSGVRLIVLSTGSRGAVASLDGVRVEVPAVEIEPVDTVGAGDAFTAGLLHWLGKADRLGGRLDQVTVDDVTEAIGFAVAVAARTCQVPGADPPWADDFRTSP